MPSIFDQMEASSKALMGWIVSSYSQDFFWILPFFVFPPQSLARGLFPTVTSDVYFSSAIFENFLLSLDLSNGLVHAVFNITAMHSLLATREVRIFLSRELENCYSVPCERLENLPELDTVLP